MAKGAVAIALTAEEREELEGLARRRKTAQGLARRARIVLAIKRFCLATLKIVKNQTKIRETSESEH
jgi:hypothetical protein